METEQDLFNINPDISTACCKTYTLPTGTEKLVIIVITGSACIEIKVTPNVSYIPPTVTNTFCSPGTNVLCLCKVVKYKKWKRKFNKIQLTVFSQHEIPETVVYDRDKIQTDTREFFLQSLGLIRSDTEYILIRSDISSPVSLQHLLAIKFAIHNTPTAEFHKHRNHKLPEKLISDFSMNPHQHFLLHDKIPSPYCSRVFFWSGHDYPIRAADKFSRGISIVQYIEATRYMTQDMIMKIFWNRYSPQLDFVWYGRKTTNMTEYKLRCLQRKTHNSLKLK